MSSSPVPELVPRWNTRRVMALTAAAVVLAGLFWFGYLFRTVLLGAFIGIIVAAAMRPVVAWLQRRGLRRELGAMIAFLVLAGLVVSFVVGVMPLVLEQISALAGKAPGMYADARGWLLESSSRLVRQGARALPARLDLGPLSPGASDLWDTARTIAVALLSAAAVLLFAFYWTLEGDFVVQAATLMAPPHRRDDARRFWAAAEQRLGGFVRGQLITCAVVGSMALTAYLIIGVPNALVFGLIAGVMEAVPVVGPTLGAIPAGLIMLSVNPTGALWVVLATVIIQLCENYLLVPRVMGRKTGVHPLLCLLAIIAFGTLFGLLGVLLAIPITVMVKLVIEFFVLGNGAAPAHAGARDHTALLRYEARTVAAAGRRLWQSGDDADARAASEEIEALAEELDGIIERRRGAA